MSISIHAPHEGCDYTLPDVAGCLTAFQSTHPMRGATVDVMDMMYDDIKFQSTHPMRGATIPELQRPRSAAYFNPRTP